jgi:hypothetical protein
VLNKRQADDINASVSAIEISIIACHIWGEVSSLTDEASNFPAGATKRSSDHSGN